MDFFDKMTPAPRAQIAGGLTIYDFFNLELQKIRNKYIYIYIFIYKCFVGGVHILFNTFM